MDPVDYWILPVSACKMTSALESVSDFSLSHTVMRLYLYSMATLCT